MHNKLAARWQAEKRQEEENRAQQIADALQRQIQQEELRQRAELEGKRTQRLTAEALEGMPQEARAIYEKDSADFLPRLAAEARAQAEAAFKAENIAQHQKEALEWRNSHPRAGSWERHQAQKEITERAAQREREYLQARADRELKAEAHDNEVERVLYSLDDRETAHLQSLVSSHPSKLDRIEQAKQTVAQREHEKRQAELRAPYEQEMREARGSTWKANIRAKYRRQGLEI